MDPEQLGAVMYADQFTGSDLAAKVNAAIAALPPEGGTVDARNFTGPQNVTSSIVLNKDVELLLPPVHISIYGAPVIVFAANGSRVIGSGNENSEVIRADPGAVIAVDTSAQRQNLEIRDLTVLGVQQSATKSGAIDIQNATAVNINDVIVHGGYYGIFVSGVVGFSIRNFQITSSAVADLELAERQSKSFASTAGGYIAAGGTVLGLGHGVDVEGFVDRVAFLHVDSNLNGGEGFRINTNGQGIDSGDAGFVRMFSCYASNDKGRGFDILSNNNKFFDIYAETGSGPGIAVSGAANDFYYAEANGFAGGGFLISGPDNRFYSLTANEGSDGVDFVPGSDNSVIFGGDINNNSGVGIDVQSENISLYHVKQHNNAEGDITMTGTLARAIGNDGIGDVLGPSVALAQSGPQIVQGSSPTPPTGPCVPGSVYLVTVPSTANMYVCQGSPSATWVAK